MINILKIYFMNFLEWYFVLTNPEEIQNYHGEQYVESNHLCTILFREDGIICMLFD